MDDVVPLADPRQTLGFLRARLAERGIGPKTKLGQNFLIDLNLLDVIVQEAGLSRDDLVLEVGCGTGSLTARLADGAGAVLAVEVDPGLFTLASELVGDRPNVALWHGDVLRKKNEIQPAIFANLSELAAQHVCKRFKLVANLPYAIATPVVANLLISEWVPARMVFTVQWELAERMTSRPGTSDYGALAVLVQSLATVRVLRRLPPNVFWPRPLVESAIMLIETEPAKRAEVGDPVAFRNFLRDLYVHKRKCVRAALIGWPSGRKEKPAVDQMLARLGIDGMVRAEDLSLPQHLQLCRAFAEMK